MRWFWFSPPSPISHDCKKATAPISLNCRIVTQIKISFLQLKIKYGLFIAIHVSTFMGRTDVIDLHWLKIRFWSAIFIPL